VDVIPQYTHIEPYRDRSFNSWRSDGSHSFKQSNTKSFVLKVTQRDYGAVLFSDAQHLLNHASEHRAHLLNLLSTNREPSPSWTLVTLYYFSLFVAMAWTRASNAAILYLDQNAVAQFCPGSTSKPAGGAYQAIATLDPATGASYVEFKKCNTSHFHEAVWITIHKHTQNLFSEIENQSSSRKPSEEEVLALRELDLFKGLSFESPLVWQSRLRNGINYRPGFSYRSVLKNNFLRTTSRLSSPTPNSLEEVISYGERAKHSILGASDPFEVANECVDLLVAQTIILEVFVNETFLRLCELHDLSCSAFRQRKSFTKQNAVASSIITALI
jgi:hypothetical protein